MFEEGLEHNQEACDINPILVWLALLIDVT